MCSGRAKWTRSRLSKLTDRRLNQALVRRAGEHVEAVVDLHSDEEVEMHMPGEPGTIAAQPDPCPDIEEAIKRSVRQAH